MSQRIAISTVTQVPAATQPARAETRPPFPWIRYLLTTLGCWHQRSRQRTALAELDDGLLQDIGLSRADALREVRKPFSQR